MLEGDPPGSVGRTAGELRRVDGTRIGAFSEAFLGPTRYADEQEVRPTDILHITSRACGPAELYGREIQRGDVTWLQYWIWQAHNGFHWARGGLHFGDWTSVTLRLRGDEPDLAAYAQHRGCEVRPWGRVRAACGHPIVYLDLGSHAARFAPSMRGNGLRAIEATLVVVNDETHPWTSWPGRWGQSRAGGRWADSPRGPGRHLEWRDPARWAAGS